MKLAHEVIDGTILVTANDLDDLLKKVLRKTASDTPHRVSPASFEGVKLVVAEILSPTFLKAPRETSGVEKYIDFQELLAELSVWIRSKGDDRSVEEIMEVFPETKDDGMRIIEGFLNYQLESILKSMIDEMTAG